MAGVNYDYSQQMIRCDQNAGFERMGLIDIQIITRFENQIRIPEANINFDDTRIAPPFHARIAVSLDVLLNPSIRVGCVMNQFRRLNIDRFTSYYLAIHTISFALDHTRGNHLGFHIVGELTVTRVELTQARLRLPVRATSSQGGGSAIEKLKREKFDGGDGEVCCPICLEELTAGMECGRMPCSHAFHSGCIILWLSKNNSCPICRRGLH